MQGYDNHSYMASNLLTNIYFFIVAIFPHTRNWDGGCHFVECILFFLIVLISTHVMSLEKKWEPWPAENPIPKLLELHVLKKKTSQNYYSCNNSMLQLHFSASFTIKLLITQKSWRHYFEIGCFCHAFFPSFGNVDLRWLHSVALFRTSISVNNICGWRCCHLWWEGYLPSPGLNSNLTGSSRCGFGHRQLKCCFSGPGLTTYISLDSRLFLSIS